MWNSSSETYWGLLSPDLIISSTFKTVHTLVKSFLKEHFYLFYEIGVSQEMSPILAISQFRYFMKISGKGKCINRNNNASLVRISLLCSLKVSWKLLSTLESIWLSGEGLENVWPTQSKNDVEYWKAYDWQGSV